MTLQKFQNLTFKTLEFYGQIVKLRIIVQLNILKKIFFEIFLKKLHSKSMPIFFSAHHSFYPQNSCFFNKCVDFLPRNLTNFDQPSNRFYNKTDENLDELRLKGTSVLIMSNLKPQF